MKIMWLSTLIFEYVDVDLEFEEATTLSKSHIIGKHQLSKMGFKEHLLKDMFAHVQEARTKARAEGHSRVVLDEEDEEEDEDEADDFHVHVWGQGPEEFMSRDEGRGDAPGLSRTAPDDGETTAPSFSIQPALDQLQSNLSFRLDTMEAHWNFQFRYLEAKVDSLSMAIYHIIGRSPPPPHYPVHLDFPYPTSPVPPTSPLPSSPLPSPSPPPSLSHFQGVKLSRVLCHPSLI